MADIEYDDHQIPTKELLKRKRKESYEQAKAAAKRARREAKEKELAEKESEREERDRQLWQMLKKAKDVKSRV